MSTISYVFNWVVLVNGWPGAYHAHKDRPSLLRGRGSYSTRTPLRHNVNITEQREKVVYILPLMTVLRKISRDMDGRN